ncbi:MAG: endonuclease [Elusimicrobiota bacterium]
MTNRTRIWLTVCLGAFLSQGADAAIRVAPIKVQAAPVTTGASGAAVGGAVKIKGLVPVSFSPSVLPTLPALKNPNIQAHTRSMRAVRSESAQVGIRDHAKKVKDVPDFAASVVADAPTVEGQPANAETQKKEEDAKAAELDKLREATEHLNRHDNSRSRIGSLNNIFDGAVHKQGTFAVRTEQDLAAIAAKTAPKRDYLAPVQDLSGRELTRKLHEISGRGYREHGYKEAKKELFSNTDNFKRNGVRGVVAAYSNVFVPGTSGDGSRYNSREDANGDGHVDRDGMNVEHLWPQSYFKQRIPMRSDLHHLMATFAHPNSSRSRYPFGEVPDHLIEYKNNAGAKLGGGYFEPPNTVKGRVARSMLYFFMRYSDRAILPGDAVQHFWNSRIELMLRWNREFPPDAFELRRNDLVEEYQGNRNPFVDDHTLADRVGVEGFLMEGGRRNTQIAQAPATSSTHAVYEQSARTPKKQKNRRNKHGRRKHRR